MRESFNPRVSSPEYFAAMGPAGCRAFRWLRGQKRKPRLGETGLSVDGLLRCVGPQLRAVQLLLGHTKIESTVRYLGIEVDDALAIAEQVKV